MAKLSDGEARGKRSGSARAGGPSPAATARPARSAPKIVELAGVRLSSPGKVLWKEQGLTKRELAQYYLDVAEWVLPHIVERPLAVVRCPSGTEERCFFQKHPWAGLSEHVERVTVTSASGDQEVLLVRDIRGVVGLVQAGVLEIHPWGARYATVEQPDRLVFDFDPGEGVAWSEVIASAVELHDRLRALKLEGFPKTTGGKGIHVVVPLAPEAGWPEAKAFAQALAEAMEADSPARYLTRAAKAERTGRIFIDFLRNARGATAIAPYSTRARSGAPVSTPLTWEEVQEAPSPDRFTVGTIPDRMRGLPADPWRGFEDLKQKLPKDVSAATRRR